MTSTREAIHARILTLLEGIADIALVERNRVREVPDGKRPALLLYDGDEDAPELPRAPRGGAFTLVTTRPAIVGFISATPASVSADLNGLIADAQSAIFGDATLRDLLGPNGAIGRGSLDVLYAAGERTEAGFVLELDITYAINLASP